MIVVIIAILAVAASVKSADLVGIRAGIAAGRVAEDLRYARTSASASAMAPSSSSPKSYISRRTAPSVQSDR